MSESTEPRPERRAHPRYPADLPARISDGDTTIEARTVDLSEGGVSLVPDEGLDARRLRIEIELAEMGWRELEAEVVRTGPDGRLAARFAHLAAGGDRDELRRFLSRYLPD
jgi:hypothetical protein